MEDAGVQRGIWDGDAKTVQQCLTDIFTSVYTTCDIPENAIFGPCVLSHTSLYDSIAFIALKSTDKRTVPYIFRVDTSAANGSSEGLMWLRLVQSAREREEQNLEAYIKSGQLFYRSLRRIAKDEELLVWYGKELTELLLLSPARAPARSNGGCPRRPPRGSWAGRGALGARDPRSKRRGREGGPKGCGRRHSGGPRVPPFPCAARLTVPLCVCVCARRRLAALRVPRVQPALPVRAALRRAPAFPLSQAAPRRRHGPRRRGRRRQRGRRQGAGGRQVLQAQRAAPPPLPRRRQRRRHHQALHGLPQPGTGARKLPRRRLARTAGAPRRQRRGGGGQGEAALPRGGGAGPRRGGAGPLRGGAAGAAQSPFLYATAFWPKSSAAAAVAAAAAGPLQLQLPSALTLLPPSFTSLCLPAQNWCAKCNASFRMTSDLVYHMRSHHKKEYAMEPLVKRRREEKLKCPICNESFRERHHLSRHMTSHN
ncbi:PRDM8 protein, partial [Crypturellus undulatus]|nr:PRDM8 protein [Crypturellus undulatus]